MPQDFINLGFSPDGVSAERLKASGITDGLSFAFRQLSAGGGPKKIAERVEAERLAAEQAEAERLAAEKAEAEARQRAENEAREAAERANRERLAAEAKAEEERLEAEATAPAVFWGRFFLREFVV